MLIRQLRPGVFVTTVTDVVGFFRIFRIGRLVVWHLIEIDDTRDGAFRLTFT